MVEKTSLGERRGRALGSDRVSRKGILLAGGAGTRLFPLTRSVSKHLLPVYDKPVVYYPLSTLMLTGIRDVLIITAPEDQSQFQGLLGDGSQWGINLEYAVQPEPEGIAQAFVISREFLDGDPSALILGDNIFFGHGLPDQLRSAAQLAQGATVFGYRVQNPERYGVVEFDDAGRAQSITEKPDQPASNYAVTGLYLYDERAPRWAEDLTPSDRGELEITDLNRRYLKNGELRVEELGRGHAWLDVGTHDSLHAASSFVKTVEERQGLKIACLEEVAYRMGWIDAADVAEAAEALSDSSYGQYLLQLVDQGVIDHSD